MSRIVSIELEDEDYHILETLAEAYGVSVEGVARLAILGVKQSYITSVANPRVAEDMLATEFGELMAGRLDRAIEREQEHAAG